MSFFQRDYRDTHPRMGWTLLMALLGLVAFTAMFCALPTKGKAAEPNWTGCYLGGNIGYLAETSRAVDDKAGTFLSPSATFDISSASDAATGGVATGCDIRFGRSPVVIGAFADIDFTNAGKSVKISTGSTSSVIGDTDINHVWGVGGRIGFLPTEHFLLYGTGGFAEADMTTKLDTAKRTKENGFFVGAGIEAMLSSGWSTKAEYRFVDLGNDTMKYGSSTNSTADVDKNIHMIKLGITYKFPAPKELSAASSALDLPTSEPAKPAAKAKAVKP